MQLHECHGLHPSLFSSSYFTYSLKVALPFWMCSLQAYSKLREDNQQKMVTMIINRKVGIANTKNAYDKLRIWTRQTFYDSGWWWWAVQDGTLSFSSCLFLYTWKMLLWFSSHNSSHIGREESQCCLWPAVLVVFVYYLHVPGSLISCSSGSSFQEKPCSRSFLWESECEIPSPRSA